MFDGVTAPLGVTEELGEFVTEPVAMLLDVAVADAVSEEVRVTVGL